MARDLLLLRLTMNSVIAPAKRLVPSKSSKIEVGNPESVADAPPHLATLQRQLSEGLSHPDLDPSRPVRIELTSPDHWCDFDSPHQVDKDLAEESLPELKRWLEPRGWEIVDTSGHVATGFGDSYLLKYRAKFAHLRRIEGTADAFEADRLKARSEVQREADEVLSRVMDSIEAQIPDRAVDAVVELDSEELGLSRVYPERIQAALREKLKASGWKGATFWLDLSYGWGDLGRNYCISQTLVLSREPRAVQGAVGGLRFGLGHVRARIMQLRQERYWNRNSGPKIDNSAFHQ